MITRVTLRNFKQFKEETFDLSGNVVLVGPNNSGKTTLLQAITLWQWVMRKWAHEAPSVPPGLNGIEYDVSSAALIEVPRAALTSVLVRVMDQLWTDRSTKAEEGDHAIEIQVELELTTGSAFASVELHHKYQELAVAQVHTTEGPKVWEAHFAAFSILSVPAFSGIGLDEPRHDEAYQSLMVGMGKPGDVLRNKMLEVAKQKPEGWKQITQTVFSLFQVTLLEPELNGYPFIVCEYVKGRLPEGARPSPAQRLDISTAGSGFLQVLVILSFFHSQKSTIVLFDEPDAHLHIVLQRQVYDELRKLAAKSRSQLIVATHSEVIVDSAHEASILSFFGKPHRLASDREAEQMRLALRELSTMDLLQADRWPCVLYLEGKSDFNLLREWAAVLHHPLHLHFLSSDQNLFWHNNIGRQPKTAKAHLFALQAVKPEMKGILLLDGDDRNLPIHEVRQDGLEVIAWKRYEAENYLLHPLALRRFIGGGLTDAEWNLFLSQTSFLQPLNMPFDDDEIQTSIGASKKFLPQMIEHFNLSISKSEYFTIASVMLPEEIHPEVRQKLDFIYTRLVGPLPS